MNKGFFGLFLVLAFSLLAACQPSVHDVHDSDNVAQKGMKLIEDNKSDEAIDLLKQEYSTNPSERICILLASAYASRAGIHAENFWGATIGYDNLVQVVPDDSSELSDLADALPGLPDNLKKTLKSAKIDITELKMVSSRLEKIPDVNDSQDQDLLTAVRTLQDSVSPGGRLYRAILEVIVFKYALNEQIIALKSAAAGGKVDCHSQWSLSLQWVQYNYQLLDNIMSDLSTAFPSKASDIQKVKTQLDNTLQDLPAKANDLLGMVCQNS